MFELGTGCKQVCNPARSPGGVLGGRFSALGAPLRALDISQVREVTLWVGFTGSSRIVFSTAINFLQKAKSVTLDALYYAAFDKDRNRSPIVDMKDFCIVNEWAPRPLP